MRRSDTIVSLNRKCAKAKRYQRKQPDAFTVYFRALWDEYMLMAKESEILMQEFRKIKP